MEVGFTKSADYRRMAVKERINKLENNGTKNVKCPGVLRKLYRELRHLDK